MKLRVLNPFRPHLLTLAALLAASSVHAADGTWNGITGNWTDTTNPGGVWSGGTIANGADFTANFTGVNIAADQTITLNGNRTIGNIISTDDTTSSNNLLITGNTSFGNLIDVRGNDTASIRVIGYNPTFSGAINLGNDLNVVSNNSFGSIIRISGGITGP